MNEITLIKTLLDSTRDITWKEKNMYMQEYKRWCPSLLDAKANSNFNDLTMF